MALIFVVCLVGCQKGGVTVTGKVTFSDGSPLTSGEVQFRGSTFDSSGTIQPDGTYKLSSNSLKDGVPKGTYKVVVKSYETYSGPPIVDMEDVKPLASLIDTKYNSPETSGLTCDVQGSMTYDITVEPFKK